MIQVLADKWNKHIAISLFFMFYIQFMYAANYYSRNHSPIQNYTVNNYGIAGKLSSKNSSKKPAINKAANAMANNSNGQNNAAMQHAIAQQMLSNSIASGALINNASAPNIGGPSSPEASSFKAVGADNLVNLFSGDFSYNVPLLDVGGYPVNLYYSAGVAMEQEASWVGLGWNINPGSVSRNMRGVPDDFNGDDKLIVEQNTKPNRTYGGSVGADGELFGIKTPKINLNVGFSHNNYLGPALDIGGGVTVNLLEPLKFEKYPKGADTSKSGGGPLSAGLNFKLSSRSGLTIAPSLNASLPLAGKYLSVGAGISTSYNSRTGIQELNISSQATLTLRSGKFDKEGRQTEGGFSRSAGLTSNSISFARPTYMPTLRMPMENNSYSGQLELGGSFWGVRGSGTGNGYFSESKVPLEYQTMSKPLYGYLFGDAAVNNEHAVMDFNRVNDGAVTPNTPIISAPQYSYDVFTIQGEGTGGSIRAFRGDVGYMKDNITQSKDKNASLGWDIAPPFHYGGNLTLASTPTTTGDWSDYTNILKDNIKFMGQNISGGSFENVYFRNPGESTVTNAAFMNNLGNDNLVRFKLDKSSEAFTRVTNDVDLFNKKTNAVEGQKLIQGQTNFSRDKRTQITTFFNAKDAAVIGLDKDIKNYTGGFTGNNFIAAAAINRVGGYRKAHHISEINVLEQSGMRYVYGLPIYNITQKEYTFTVGALPDANNQVVFGDIESTINSPHMFKKAPLDGYVMTQQTPAYASAFLLSGLLSPDYVDVTGNGITEDDLGSAVKFNYNKSADNHKWRTPRATTTNKAHFNAGLRTRKKDNKATLSYGEKEVWYLSSIESKTSVAIFKTGSRKDAKGVNDALAGLTNGNEQANKRLDRIDLYSKAEIKAKGINNATPIKTVHFVYDYSLCKGTPDNAATAAGNSGWHPDSTGKLTLKSVYFTYYGQSRASKDKYVFDYGSSQNDNPNYALNASDKWGNFKHADANPTTFGSTTNRLPNYDYPFSDTLRSRADQAAGAWNLKRILLPSGGQMEVTYEADDYGYVQNRRAANMYSIAGLGSTPNFNATGNLGALYNYLVNNDYVYVKLAQPLTSSIANPIALKREIFEKYLQQGNGEAGTDNIAFKLMVNMPDGLEPITVYTDYEDFGLCANKTTTKDYIYIKVKSPEGINPLANSAINFLTESLPGQAFPGYEIEVDDLQGFIDIAGAMVTNITNAFANVENQMRSAGKARLINLDQSFVRLNNADKIKIGGGYRVKKVIVKDNWSKMKGGFTSTYGQEYDYTTTEPLNGQIKTISSGVASYETGLGSEENPFRSTISYTNKVRLATDQFGNVEMPVLESFFPSADVGYSKVTVRSIHRKGTHGDSTLKSAIGKQVTEYFTAKDYPTTYNNSIIDETDYHAESAFNFLRKEIFDRKVQSQGFIVETNDMHGKMKAQLSYSESDPKTPLTSSYHYYKNTGKNGFNDKVAFVNNKASGAVTQGNMGIDMELMTDVRLFNVTGRTSNNQLQVDILYFAIGAIPVPTFFPAKTYVENTYKAVTCTKLINYHAIEDSVVLIDKGSSLTTKTIAYDAETGTPIVTQTANEFNDPIYNINYPAYWAYSGMGLAYENIDIRHSNVTFANGKISLSQADQNRIFESGDELFVTAGAGTNPSCAEESSSSIRKIWAYDINKNNTALTVANKDFIFMDAQGFIYNKSNVSFRIVRSGKRNTIGASLASFTTMQNPIVNGFLNITNASNVVASSAMEYKEKWQTDADVFPKYTTTYNSATCSLVTTLDCVNGKYQNHLNPYIKSLIGNFKPHRSYVYYGSRTENQLSNPTQIATDIRKNGYLQNFDSYWTFNGNSNLVPSTSNTKWVWNSEITRVNSKGQELETKNALDIFTAAQYGFNKNLTTAIANNSKANEMFAESFEDYNYGENINQVPATCQKKDLQIENSSNAAIAEGDVIVNPTTYQIKYINAHSGKKLLKVNQNSEVDNSIKIAESIINNFYLGLNIDTIIKPNAIGGSLLGANFNVQGPGGPNSLPVSVSWGLGSAIVTHTNEIDNSYSCSQNPGSTVGSTSEFLIPIQNPGIYYFTVSTTGQLNQYLTGNMNFVFKNSLGATIPYTIGNPSSICLPAGLNKLVIEANSDRQCYCSPSSLNNEANTDCGSSSGMTFKLSFLDQSILGYKDLSSSDTCYGLKPIPTTDSMINPTFSPTPGKKMVFSAWVREEAAQNTASYTNSQVQLLFNNGAATNVTLSPTGAIIDGWQKIEGEFIIPIDASTMNIKLINNGSQANYWDDLRMHPFNANLKSYAYDDKTLRLLAELDENNYAAFYEYDEEGQLIRVKKETIQGIKTIKESRSAKQKIITELQ